MIRNAADVLLDRILEWGVEVMFGMPGDGMNGIIKVLRKRQDKIRFIQVQHEKSTAFMAYAYAKYTGKPGVCLATSGPDGLHLLTGLYDAKLDGQPVLAITGHHFHDLIDTHVQQEAASIWSLPTSRSITCESWDRVMWSRSPTSRAGPPSSIMA